MSCNDLERTTPDAGDTLVPSPLPLFAVGVVIAQGLNSLRLATTWSQWFLKNGSKQPFRAIGFVAALVVFLGAAALQLLFAWLSGASR